jgi:DNA-binding response OmpR family regulator
LTAHAGALVLLVDDSEPVRDAYTILLQESGYRVAAAADALTALRAASETPPDIVLLDLGLPGLDGLHVVRALKGAAATAHVPVLALTGRDDPESRQACADAGCAEFLVKPFPTQLLLRTLADHLSRS